MVAIQLAFDFIVKKVLKSGDKRCKELLKKQKMKNLKHESLFTQDAGKRVELVDVFFYAKHQRNRDRRR
jgi:hypothetical protein